MEINKNRLKEILEMPAISGREFKLSAYLETFFKELGFEIEYDNLGSLIASKKAKVKNAQRLVIDAHMDEVGFMITDITDNGLLKFEEHGYINEVILPTQRVRVWDKDLDKYVIGVIGNDSTKTLNKKIPEIAKMFIDIGAASKKEVETKFKLEVGNTITFDGDAVFNNKRVITKAADDRVGIALLCDVAEQFAQEELAYDLYLVASVQEEVGIRGARTSAFKIGPDLVLTVDTSPAKDFPTSKQEGDLGLGTFLRHQDRGYITPVRSIEFLRSVLETNKIKYQDYFSTGGTNAFGYSLSKSGSLILPIGLVVRNIHSASIIFDLNDYQQTQTLIAEILVKLNQNKSLDL